MCDDCIRWQSENARLRGQVQRAKVVIERQKQQLDLVRKAAWKILMQSKAVLGRHAPRGTWSLWKGRGESAYAIFRIVFKDWTGLVGDILGG